MDNVLVAKDKALISILVPLYNEESNVALFIDEVTEVIKNVPNPFEFIFVDDGSSDNTWNTLSERINKSNVPIRAVRFSRNFGKESALAAGLELLDSDAVIILDGDLQHPPSAIPELVNKWVTTNTDIVEAVKLDRGKESLFNRLSVSIFYSIINKLSGFDLTGASDYKLLSRTAIDSWRAMKESNLFFRGMSAWLGFEKKKVYFEVVERESGETGWSKLKLLQLALTAITAFTYIPLHLVTVLGIIFLIFSTILGIQTFVNWYLGDAVSGFTTVIILQLLIGSFLMISLGIIGEYIARIYFEVKRRPRYIVSARIDNIAND